MKGKSFVILASTTLVALVAIGVILLPRLAANKPKPAAQAAAPAPLRVPEVQLTGKIRAQNIVNVAAPIEGTVAAFFVDVGQEVFEGQLLARISNEGLDSGERSAQTTLEAAQARADTLGSQIVAARLEASRARADATRARSEYDRLEKLYSRQQMLYTAGATPRLTYEKTSRDFDLAKSEFQNLERVAAAAESRVDELTKSLDAEKRVLAEKTSDVETAKARAGAAEMVSPTPGLVVGRNGQVGQPIAPDKVDFFQIATRLSELEVVLDPDPRSMRRIQPGQAALVTLPDLGADGMVGAVKSIEGEQVIVAFSSPNPAVRPGMTAQVRIKV